MSTEIERRLKVLENKIAHAVPCKHPLAILSNPTDEEIEEMEQMLDECPNCNQRAGIGPSIIIIRYPDF